MTTEAREPVAVAVDGFVAAYTAGHAGTVRLAYVLCGDLARAEEVSHDAWVNAYQRHQRHPLDDVVSYVRRSVVNGVHSSARRVSVERAYLRLVRREPAAARMEQGIEDRAELIPLLDRLPERMRTVVALRFHADMSVAETAVLMGITEGTVKSTTSKALAQLRQLWGAAHDD
ncbi:SigE family RNA polymerase sigma factor [soil metagenome]